MRQVLWIALAFCLALVAVDERAAGEVMNTTDLIRLCETGTPQMVLAALAGGADVNARGEDGGTALMAAAVRNENPDVISVLMKAGADANARVNGVTVLMWAAGYSKNPEVIRALVQAGADVNARNESGWTALMSAAIKNENPEVIGVMVEAGADVNARNSEDKTALDLSAKNKNAKVRTVLVKTVTDMNARDKEGGGADHANLEGDWSGKYTANQGETALTLSVQKVTNDGTINAIFKFSATRTNPGVPSGSFKMIGLIDPSTRKVVLKATEWIQRPSKHWVTVDLYGSLSGDNSTITGVIDSPHTNGKFEVKKISINAQLSDMSKRPSQQLSTQVIRVKSEPKDMSISDFSMGMSHDEVNKVILEYGYSYLIGNFALVQLGISGSGGNFYWDRLGFKTCYTPNLPEITQWMFTFINEKLVQITMTPKGLEQIDIIKKLDKIYPGIVIAEYLEITGQFSGVKKIWKGQIDNIPSVLLTGKRGIDGGVDQKKASLVFIGLSDKFDVCCVGNNIIYSIKDHENIFSGMRKKYENDEKEKKEQIKRQKLENQKF